MPISKPQSTTVVQSFHENQLVVKWQINGQWTLDLILLILVFFIINYRCLMFSTCVLSTTTYFDYSLCIANSKAHITFLYFCPASSNRMTFLIYFKGTILLTD